MIKSTLQLLAAIGASQAQISDSVRVNGFGGLRIKWDLSARSCGCGNGLGCPSWRHLLTGGCELLTGRESPIALIAMLRRGAFSSQLVKVVAKSPVILLSYENLSFGGNRRVQFLSPSGKPSRTRYNY